MVNCIAEFVQRNPFVSTVIITSLLILVALFVVTAIQSAKTKSDAILNSLHNEFPIDLTKYAGKWFEVTRLPNRFQQDCVNCTTAEYTIDETDGSVSVLNQCDRADGTRSYANGYAWPAKDDEQNNWLKVSFIPYAAKSWPVSLLAGDYLIHYVDENYQTAVVGSPDRDSFWLLSRTPTLAEERRQELLQKATALGYNVDNMIKTGCQ